MDGPIVGIVIIVLVISLYFFTYILNSNTKAPEGAIKISKCSTCGTGSCSLADKIKFQDKEEECTIYELDESNR